ncbi:MAG: hypothetical protein ACPGJS_00770 [Flammeovirgaceae bacterium]
MKRRKSLEWRTTHLREIAKNWWEPPAYFSECLGLGRDHLLQMRAAILTQYPEFIELYAPDLIHLLPQNEQTHENTSGN